MVLTREEDEHNYLGLGFVPDQLNLKLKVGHVEVTALDYPLGGIAVFFSGVGPDEAAYFESRLPNRLSAEMVAGMIYVNIVRAFPKDAPSWKRHFQSLKLPLFQ